MVNCYKCEKTEVAEEFQRCSLCEATHKELCAKLDAQPKHYEAKVREKFYSWKEMKKGIKKIKGGVPTNVPFRLQEINYKATLKSLGRVYQSEGATIEEAIRGIKVSGGAKVTSVLSIEHGDKKTDRIINGITAHRLFSQGSPTTREIHLSKVCMLFI